MNKYAELSKRQKVVIDTMRQGGKLSYLVYSNKFILTDARGFTIYVNNLTGNTLALRGFIITINQMEDRTIFQLNPIYGKDCQDAKEQTRLRLIKELAELDKE